MQRACAVYGTVDELNSQLGLALATGLCDRLANVLPEIQNELFDLGSDLCFTEADKQKYPVPQMEAWHVARLEALIDEMNAAVGPLQNFILPGGTLGSAQLHVGADNLPARGTRGSDPGAGRADRRACDELSQPAVGCPLRDGTI